MPVSVLSIYYIERRNESHLLPDFSSISDKIYVLLGNGLFFIDLVQSEVCDYLFKLNKSQYVVVHHNVLAGRDNQV